MNKIDEIRNIINEKNAECAIINNTTDVRYLSGVVSSNIMILITKNKAYVLSDGRYKYAIERAEGYIPLCTDKKLLSCIKDKLMELNIKRILLNPLEYNYKEYLFLKEDFEIIEKENITKELRIIKSETEKESIIKAQRIAERAYLEILKLIKPGLTTREIAAKLDYLMNMYGSEEVAFPSIVINGENTADCHGMLQDSKIKNKDILLFDFGATYNGYRSDMTRTVFIGDASDEERKIYNIVLNAHIKSASMLKPAIKCSEVDKCARNIISDAGYKEFFLHSLGHGVGMDIHEYPVLSPRSNDVLCENQIVTIEPGIYLGNKFGIRIEDTYIINKNSADSIANVEKTLVII